MAEFAPAAQADQFEGAEGAIDQQRAEALAALAQFGRRGLEEAVLGQREVAGVAGEARTAATVGGRSSGMNEALSGELRASTDRALGAYTADATRRSSFLSGENAASQVVNDTYFKQAAEAVPMMREGAAETVNEYRQAYEERQAAIAAEKAEREEARQQAAIQLGMQQAAMAQNAAIANAQMAASREAAAMAAAGYGITGRLPVIPRPTIGWGSPGYGSSRGGWGGRNTNATPARPKAPRVATRSADAYRRHQEATGMSGVRR